MSPELTDHTQVAAIENQVSTKVEGDVVILDLSAGVYYGLDAVGARVWDLVQEPTTLGELRDAIVREFDVEPDRCRRDLATLLQELDAHGLVQLGR